MLDAARAGEADGLWIVAGRQLAGRGRQGRAWTSLDGNLHASGLVRLRPGDPPAATLALVVGIAALDTLHHYAGAALLRLKWPNDILCDGAKLAGLLLEREGDAVVVGVGANIARHPALADRRTTSLHALGDVIPQPIDVAHRLAAAVADWVERWRMAGVGSIVAAWRARAHPVGTVLRVMQGEETVTGTFLGLTTDGALRLGLANGSETVIYAGDIVWEQANAAGG